MEQVVRRARPGDADAVQQLELEARTSLLEQRGGPQLLAEQPPVEHWTAVIASPDRAVFVGEIDAVVVAYLELELGERTAVVRQVHVHPEARDLGFGDEMLAMATDAAIAAGCEVIEGSALPGDRNTKNLYERAGIVARKIITSKRLLPPS